MSVEPQSMSMLFSSQVHCLLLAWIPQMLPAGELQGELLVLPSISTSVNKGSYPGATVEATCHLLPAVGAVGDSTCWCWGLQGRCCLSALSAFICLQVELQGVSLVVLSVFRDADQARQLADLVQRHGGIMGAAVCCAENGGSPYDEWTTCDRDRDQLLDR